MDEEHFKRRMEKRRSLKPKGLGEVLRPLGTSQFQTNRAPKKEDEMKAKSTRYRGRTLVVGKTPFVFDRDGVCTFTPRGNAIIDFQALLNMSGVEEVTDRSADITVKVDPIIIPLSAIREMAIENAVEPPMPVPVLQQEEVIEAPPAPSPESDEPAEGEPEAPNADVSATEGSTPPLEYRSARRRRAAKQQQEG
jgi:hypothetical protein